MSSNCEVWLPLLAINNRVMTWTPQRLPELLPSTTSTEIKMEEAANVADKMAQRYLGDEKAAAKNLNLDSIKSLVHVTSGMLDLPRPKTLGRIRQKRLSAREHLRALGHILSQLDLDILTNDRPMTPILAGEERRAVHHSRPFKWRTSDGTSVWDDIPEAADSCRPRLVLCPDEGSPMFSAWQFLVSRGALVHLARDEL